MNLSLAEQVLYKLDELKLRVILLAAQKRMLTEQEEVALSTLLLFLESTKQSVLPQPSLRVEIPVWCSN